MTNSEIIDDLGEWICIDMMKEARKGMCDPSNPISTDRARALNVIKDVCDRIKFYRDNVMQKEEENDK